MALEAANREDFKQLMDGMDKKELLNFARVCENAERFEDMSDVMKMIVTKSEGGKGLTDDHQALMSVAFKNVVGDLRKAMRKLEVEVPEEGMEELHKSYKKRIVAQVKKQCEGVIGLLRDNLINKEFVSSHNQKWEEHAAEANKNKDAKEAAKESSTQVQEQFMKGLNLDNEGDYLKKLEAQTFFLKMLGDYWRYLSEADPSEDSIKAADANYTNAWKMAKSFMAPTHPTRLGLALNSSVFVQEIQKNTVKAQNIAKEAFESAIQSLDTLNDTSYKDSTLIMQLLRDNLTIWQDQPEKAIEQED